jgi:hypothetical protein
MNARIQELEAVLGSQQLRGSALVPVLPRAVSAPDVPVSDRIYVPTSHSPLHVCPCSMVLRYHDAVLLLSHHSAF